jgi:nitroreductase/NAD-dependent dihydropyrimidine dehydrogenase PreA subunit
MSRVTIDPEKCRRDGLCISICEKVFSRTDKGSVPQAAREGACNSCGHCVLICPSGAIHQADCPSENVHPVTNELLPSYDQVREMIITRRSTRTFQGRPVGRETIEAVIEGARFAPSAKNSQSTRYLVVQDGSLLRAIASSAAEWLGKVAGRLKNPVWRALYMLAGEADGEEIKRYIEQFDHTARSMHEGRDMILFGAPALLLFYADKADRFGNVNANLALQNATMIASSLGLGSFYTGYVVTACGYEKKIPRLLGLSKRYKIYGGLALGYPKIRFAKWIDRNPAEITWR